jgi:hypothetical protein
MSDEDQPALRPEDIGQLFRDFRHSAFRLETLDSYAISTEETAFAAWMDGREIPLDEDMDGWLEIVRDARAAGKTMQRVHVIREPVTDYVHWELGWGQKHSVAAGEDIRLIPHRGDEWPARIPQPGYDFWLFDEAHPGEAKVAIYRFDESKRPVKLTISKSPSVIAQFCQWRDAALEAAIPFHLYVDRNPWILEPVGAAQ